MLSSPASENAWRLGRRCGSSKRVMDLLSDCYSAVAAACGLVVLVFGGGVAMEDPTDKRAAVASRWGVAVAVVLICKTTCPVSHFTAPAL